MDASPRKATKKAKTPVKKYVGRSRRKEVDCKTILRRLRKNYKVILNKGTNYITKKRSGSETFFSECLDWLIKKEFTEYLGDHEFRFYLASLCYHKDLKELID
jgi:hypothetical protein